MYKIHIIEDNKTYSSIVTKKLRKEGFDVSQAFSTNEEIPDADVYLIDLHLNEMSFDLIKRIKYRKIIVMSGYGDKENIDRAKAYGADRYLVKVIMPDDLILEINNLLGDTHITKT